MCWYELMGRMAAARGARGQGTVEYVGVLVVMGTILAAVIGAVSGEGDGLAKAFVSEIKDQIEKVGGSK